MLRAEAPAVASLEIMTPRQTALIAKCRTTSACLSSLIYSFGLLNDTVEGKSSLLKTQGKGRNSRLIIASLKCL